MTAVAALAAARALPGRYYKADIADEQLEPLFFCMEELERVIECRRFSGERPLFAWTKKTARTKSCPSGYARL